MDYVVIGEGEETVPELLCSLKTGDSHRVKGIAYMNNGKIVKTVPRPRMTNINKPWSLEKVLLLPDGNYRYDDESSRRHSLYSYKTNPKKQRDFALYYSRGCPSRCTYCTASVVDGTKIRYAGAHRVMQDVRNLHENYGVSIFFNQADTFGIHMEDRKFLEELGEYRKGHPNVILNNPNAFFARHFFLNSDGNKLNEKLLDIYKNAGLNVVTIAVETFNQRLNKKIDFDKITPGKLGELCGAFHDRDIKTEIYMMYGFPSQTIEELEYDEKTIRSIPDLDLIGWNNYMIFPGTADYEKAIREKWFTEDSYRKTIKDIGSFFSAVAPGLNLSKITEYELASFRQRNIYPE